MPKTRRREKKTKRTGVSIPNTLLEEIDRTIQAFTKLHWNRQQFIETAIRELLRKYAIIEAAKKMGDQSGSPQLSHIIELVNGLNGTVIGEYHARPNQKEEITQLLASPQMQNLFKNQNLIYREKPLKWHKRTIPQTKTI